MSNDRELRIKITTEANLAALTKTRTELQGLKDSAVAMGVGTGDLDKQIAALDNQIATLGRKSVPEAAEGLAGFNIEGRETLRLAGELDRLQPGAGALLRGFKEPDVLGLIAFGLAVEYVRNKIADMMKAAEEAQKRLLDLSQANVTGWVDSLHDANDAQDEFNKKLGEGISLTAQIKAGQDEVLHTIEEQRKNTDAILEAEEKLLIAHAGGDKAKEAAIRAQFSDAKAGAQLDADRQALAAARSGAAGLPDEESDFARISGLDAAARRARQNEDQQTPALKQQLKELTDGIAKTQISIDQAKAAGRDTSLTEFALGLEKDKATKLQAEIDGLANKTKEANAALDDAIKSHKEISAASDEYARKIREAAAALATDTQASGLNRETSLIQLFQQRSEQLGYKPEEIRAALDAVIKKGGDTLIGVVKSLSDADALLATRIASVIHNPGTP